MTDNLDSDGDKPREPYEPPQAVRLNSRDFAFGACTDNGIGDSAARKLEGCYRGNGVASDYCVTGKAAGFRCKNGIQGAS